MYQGGGWSSIVTYHPENGFNGLNKKMQKNLKHLQAD